MQSNHQMFHCEQRWQLLIICCCHSLHCKQELNSNVLSKNILKNVGNNSLNRRISIFDVGTLCCTFFFCSDYMFVTPVEVDSEGGYLTHDVTRRSHRSKRSLSSSLHYRLSAFGQDMHLDLHPSSVVGPGFSVQMLGADGIATVMNDAGFHNCLYQGFIRNLSASSAAISTCSGLVSVCQ